MLLLVLDCGKRFQTFVLVVRDISDKSSAPILYGSVVDRCVLRGGTKTAHSVISLQRLLIYSTQVDRFSVSLRDIHPSDVIISNCVGYVQILIYSAMFLSFLHVHFQYLQRVRLR